MNGRIVMKLSEENAEKVLFKYLKDDEKKCSHSLRVRDISKILAKKWRVSENEVAISALLHDIGKHLNRRKMLEYCSMHGITMYDFEVYDNVAALHGRISADIFEKEFLEENGNESLERIKKAIERHVAGSGKMTDLEKVIFIADNIEPEKKDSDILKLIQDTKISMDECIKLIANRKVERADKRGIAYNPFLDATLEGIEK